MTLALDTVHHMDALALCAALEPQSVDMILCDPPYGTTACAWDTVIPFAPMWAAFRRVITPRGAIVLTASQPFTSALVMSNPTMFKYAWVWVKSRSTDFLNAKNKPLRRHEDVLVFSLGTTANKSPSLMRYYPQGLKSNRQRVYRPHGTVATKVIGKRPSHVNEYVSEFSNWPDTVLCFESGNNFNVHPTQKPVALFDYLIRTYTQPGDVVLDPCVGSGTTAVAARQSGRHYIVGDSSAEYVAVARKRLALPFTLPMFDRAEAANE